LLVGHTKTANHSADPPVIVTETTQPGMAVRKSVELGGSRDWQKPLDAVMLG
jgi:hypothetical protein